jgi:predicted metal-dependent phosphoesterase TrpH
VRSRKSPIGVDGRRATSDERFLYTEISGVRLIDLHTHTDESDGTSAPDELVGAAVALGLEALGITDHDTFAGYDVAAPLAREVGLDLVCGIELSTKRHRATGARARSIHLLGYFLHEPPPQEFRAWLEGIRVARRDRNRRLADRLQSLGLDITLEEVERLGRSQAGRPHFARVMVEKGYVASIQEAFDLYLDESAKGYVERDEPELEAGIRKLCEAGALSSLAHPIRLSRRNPASFEKDLAEMCAMGLGAIEAYHSDHLQTDTAFFLSLARRYRLAVTGGTDFHGDNKPGLALGTGYGNVAVPRQVLEALRNG